ncbi:hypothetical protein SRB5_10580 [Streptomyces sp. RB5]|uniref:Uncharacterized protein n=1 Tax=Streptomyces smaragdinus TaxID=2585196 RepID=A0A7K0CDU5_9ACTN|nr:hypothetical protein [Streptomyces smaragdinus]MQY10944.1 hypothetical protein [Streptomyces smaragdinus]
MMDQGPQTIDAALADSPVAMAASYCDKVAEEQPAILTDELRAAFRQLRQDTGWRGPPRRDLAASPQQLDP